MSRTDQPVIIITGASQGLGAALAQVLLTQSYRIAFCARTVSRVNETVATLGFADRVLARAGDVTDAEFRRTFVAETVTTFGRIDAIVNNASTLGDTPLPQLAETSAANLRHVMEVNFIAPILWLQETLPYLAANKRALVVGISSDAAKAGYPGWGVYGSSKAALDLAHRTLGAELPQTVTALAVDPGDMDTAMHHAAIPDDVGMAPPSSVAEVLATLFSPLTQDVDSPFSSGTRLRVAHGHLIVDDGV